MLHSILRPFASSARAFTRLPSFIFGSLRFAWAPPPWLRSITKIITPRALAAMLLLAISATIAGAALRGSRHLGPQQPQAVPIAAAPATPSDPNARDTTKPRIREVKARVAWSAVGWDEQRKKPAGTPLNIRFDAPAAPLKLLGKIAAPGTVKLTPEIPGVWTWTNSQTLTFEPQGGWMPPRDYGFTLGDGVFAADCTVTLKKAHRDVWRQLVLHRPRDARAATGCRHGHVQPARRSRRSPALPLGHKRERRSALRPQRQAAGDRR